jgi:DNA-binding MarR family transcriptional regulator
MFTVVYINIDDILISTPLICDQKSAPIVTEAELDGCLECMHFAFRALVQEPDRILSRHKLGRAHHRALYCIGHYAPSVGQAARSLRVSKQAFHRTMRELIERNLIRSQPDPRNARSRRLILTAKGRRLEQQLSGVQRDMFAKVEREVGQGKMAAWTAVMAALAAQSRLPTADK